MDDYDTNIPEEAVSDHPDNKDVGEDVEGKCSECGSEKMTRSPRASSPDDFTYQYDCQGCGATWEG